MYHIYFWLAFSSQMKIKLHAASPEFCSVSYHFDHWQALTDEACDLILDCWIVWFRIHGLDGLAG
jgi:hypothetical protein